MARKIERGVVGGESEKEEKEVRVTDPLIVLRNSVNNKKFDIPAEQIGSFCRVDESVPHPQTKELGCLVLEPQYKIVRGREYVPRHIVVPR